MIIRAVHYLEQTHVIPPKQDDAYWFQEAIHILIELACPGGCVEGQALHFMKDIVGGCLESCLYNK